MLYNICAWGIFALCILFGIWLFYSYRKNFSETDNAKVKKWRAIELYVVAIAFLLFIGGLVFIIIEGVFRTSWIKSQSSAFDEAVTAQLIIGIVGAVATMVLGFITLLFTKKVNLHNESMTNAKIIGDWSKYLYNFSDKKFYIVDRSITYSIENPSVINFMIINKHIKQNDICFIFNPEQMLPNYIDVKVSNVKIQTQNNEIIEIEAVETKRTQDALIVIIKKNNNRTEIHNLLLMQYFSYHFVENFNGFTINLTMTLKSKLKGYVIENTVSCKFDVESSLSCMNYFLPEFKILNCEVVCE